MSTKQPFDWRAHLKVHPAADEFPLLADTDPKALQELADDIKRNGLQQPIVIWDYRDELWLLDGRNRLDALALLGRLALVDYGRPGLIMTERSPKDIWNLFHFEYDHPLKARDPYSIALSLNLHRRHLDSQQKRDLIAKLLKANPEASDRKIAKTVGVSHPTVGAIRDELESTGKIYQLEKTVGADGKARKNPAKKPERKPTELEALRERAAKLGYKLRKRGDSYGLIPTDGEGGESWGPIEGTSELLDGMEGKRAWQAYTECGMRIDGVNNSRAWLAAHPGATMEDFEQALPPLQTGCEIASAEPSQSLAERTALQPSDDASATANDELPPMQEASSGIINKCLKDFQHPVDVALTLLIANDDPQAIGVLFDQLEARLAIMRAEAKRKADKLAAEIMAEHKEAA
jgi:ParB-like nuclease domain